MINVQAQLHFRGMTQSEIAGRLGISRAWFSKWCNGAAPIPLEKVIALSELLDAPVEDVARAFNRIWIEKRPVNWGRRRSSIGAIVAHGGV